VALANSVFAYASNADNLGALSDTVALLAHKHVSFDVLPEHYPIVGECLLEALKVLKLQFYVLYYYLIT
jgi:nitric oxide dioxygenase